MSDRLLHTASIVHDMVDCACCRAHLIAAAELILLHYKPKLGPEGEAEVKAIIADYTLSETPTHGRA